MGVLLTELVNTYILGILLISFFPLNESIGNRIYILLVVGNFTASILLQKSKHKILFPKYVAFQIFLLLFAYFYGRKTTHYDQMYMLVSFFVLVCIYWMILNEIYISSIKIDWLYYVLLIIITYNLLKSLYIDEIFNIVIDTNYSAIFLFLFFLYSNKRKHLMGIILSLSFILLTESRAYILLIVLFYAFYLFRMISPQLASKVINLDMGIWISIIMAGSIIFSFFWAFIVAKNGYTEYHMSLNDNSNYTRAVSVIYGMRMMIRNYKTLLFGGYGLDLRKHMNIVSTSGFYTRYMGTRLVQAHNSYLNLLLSIGITPGVFYFFLMAKILNFVKERSSVEYIFPYLIIACLMHSLLNLRWCLFWIIILLIPSKEKLRIFKFVYKGKGNTGGLNE